MAPIPPSPASPAAAVNVMGPPQRPAEKPTKDYEYEVTDSLAGTGIDLRAEEQYMSELFSNSMETNLGARTGFARHAAGPKSSFYGAGPANQPPETTKTQSQDQLAAKAAEQVWAESSMRLAVERTQEVNDPFLLVALLHRRADKIAREHQLGLNLDMKNTNQSMGKMRLPEQFPAPQVTVRMAPGPDSTMIETTGTFLPYDSFLVDQVALMSIATKQRLRELVEEAGVLAVNRQKTCHGDVPADWKCATAPMNAEPLEPMDVAGEAMELTSAEDTGTKPLKRSADAANLEEGATRAKKLPKVVSYMTLSVRERARQEREWEEARLRRRQRRKEGEAEAATAASRSGSAGPGTPGSVAPEQPEKPMSKKEWKKNQALRAAEANSHANQNLTSSMFAGLSGKGSLFGKKKTGKTYDWITAGRSASGTSTPSRATPGPRGANGTLGTPGAPNHALTTDGRNRLGSWREDKEKGKKIQLRDWVTVLERDGREARALAAAYVQLENASPK